MKATHEDRNVASLAATIAPEDMNCGDYIAMLNVVYQYPSFLWCCDSSSVEPDEPVQVQFRAPGAGTPLKIKAICLPFVCVKSPKGGTQTLDVRQYQFVRLAPEYAKAVWKDLK